MSGAHTYIDKIPLDSTATLHSICNYFCSQFVFYSVVSSNGRTKIFYEFIEDPDPDERIDYDSTRQICSFDSTERITFVSTNNEGFFSKNELVFYEYQFDYQNRFFENVHKVFLVIFQNKIVLFWHDNLGKVIVKTLDLSSFDSFDFTRVNPNIELFDWFSLTFYTIPSTDNVYYSLQVSSDSIFDSNDANYVLKKHTFNIPCYLSLSGSQFIPDTDDKIKRGVLKMRCHVHVNGNLQEDDSDDSDDSEDDY
jgi:hypothetical protein